MNFLPVVLNICCFLSMHMVVWFSVLVSSDYLDLPSVYIVGFMCLHVVIDSGDLTYIFRCRIPLHNTGWRLLQWPRRYSAPCMEVGAEHLGDRTCRCQSLGSVQLHSRDLSGVLHIIGKAKQVRCWIQGPSVVSVVVQGEISLWVQWPVSPFHLHCVLAFFYRYGDPMVVVCLWCFSVGKCSGTSSKPSWLTREQRICRPIKDGNNEQRSELRPGYWWFLRAQSQPVKEWLNRSSSRWTDMGVFETAWNTGHELICSQWEQ